MPRRGAHCSPHACTREATSAPVRARTGVSIRLGRVARRQPVAGQVHLRPVARAAQLERVACHAGRGKALAFGRASVGLEEAALRSRGAIRVARAGGWSCVCGAGVCGRARLGLFAIAGSGARRRRWGRAIGALHYQHRRAAADDRAVGRARANGTRVATVRVLARPERPVRARRTRQCDAGARIGRSCVDGHTLGSAPSTAPIRLLDAGRRGRGVARTGQCGRRIAAIGRAAPPAVRGVCHGYARVRGAAERGSRTAALAVGTHQKGREDQRRDDPCGGTMQVGEGDYSELESMSRAGHARRWIALSATPMRERRRGDEARSAARLSCCGTNWPTGSSPRAPSPHPRPISAARAG